VKQPGRHFIFTSGRSGSNYLSNTLNLSPECVNFGEVLGFRTLPYKLFGKHVCKTFGAETYLNYLYHSDIYFYLAQFYSAYSHVRTGRKINFKFKRKLRSIGLKDFLVTMERHNALDYLRQNEDIKIIYLHRENLLKRFISAQHLMKSRIPASYKSIDIEPIELNLDDLVNHLDIYNSEAERELEFLNSMPDRKILNITYESYFADSNSITDWNKTISEFLDISLISTVSKQKKLLADTLPDAVSNSSEVVGKLTGTRYEKYLY